MKKGTVKNTDGEEEDADHLYICPNHYDNSSESKFAAIDLTEMYHEFVAD